MHAHDDFLSTAHPTRRVCSSTWPSRTDSRTTVPRPWSATSSFPRRWLTDADKAHLESLAPMTPAEEAKEALKEKGIVAPEPVLAEIEAEETLLQKIKSALPFIGGKVKKD